MALMLAWLNENEFTARQDIVTLDESGLLAMLRWASRAASLNCERPGCNPPYTAEIHP